MGLTQEIIIPCYLDRTALKWYENIEERLGAALTWEQLKAAMKDAFKTIAWEEQLGVQITNAYAGRGRPKLQAYPLIVYASPYCLYPDGAHASVKKNKLERQQEEGVPPVAAASTPASKRPRLAAAAEVAPALTA
ncbi:hypothetical protein J6590_077644 [Homalodisca vitripennis]|nr:hypothetical protein J6590_077644 [Homalodisca vitripennis]